MLVKGATEVIVLIGSLWMALPKCLHLMNTGQKQHQLISIWYCQPDYFLCREVSENMVWLNTWRLWIFEYQNCFCYFNGLVQERCVSAMELHLSCTNPLIQLVIRNSYNMVIVTYLVKYIPLNMFLNWEFYPITWKIVVNSLRYFQWNHTEDHINHRFVKTGMQGGGHSVCLRIL